MALKRFTEERKEKQQKLMLQERDLLLQEYKEGLITREEYRAQIYKTHSSEPHSAARSSSPSYAGENGSFYAGGSDDVVGDGWEK